jgi:putative DNA primase/helicase
MDDFLRFAAWHGLIIGDIQPGRITRCKTVDHPHKKNGAFMFDGEWGWCQNWADSDKPVIWQGKESKLTQIEIRQKIKESTAERDHQFQEAIRKAAWMIKQAKPGTHDYLALKGHPEAIGLIMQKDAGDLLLIPMRIINNLVGLQVIAKDESGYRKTFLKGSKTKDACYVIGRGGLPIHCEGYVTGLSIHRALNRSKLSGHVVVCFSAGNMVHVAKTGYVVADNDASGTGEKCAKQTGLPYFMPPDLGDDFNDYEMRGQLEAMMQIKKLLKPG